MSTQRVRTARKAVQRKDAGSGFFVYIGPTLRGVIEHGRVFFGSREDADRAAARACAHEPLIRQLIVPGETLAEDRLKVKTPGTALYEFNKRVAGTVRR